MQPDKYVIESCARLKAEHPNFVSWLQRRQAEAGRDAAMHIDEVVVRRAQGRYQELEEILALIMNGADYLRKA